MLRRTSVIFGTALLMTMASWGIAQQQGQRPGGPPGGFGGFGGFGFGGVSGILAMPEVQKELAVTEEQKELIDDMLSDLRAAGGGPNFGDLQNLSEEERRKQFEEFRKQGEERAKKAEEMAKMILEPQQFERLSQLRLQREGVGAFSRPEIAKQLGLSDDQLARIRKIQEDARPQGRGGFGGPGGFQNLSEEERRAFFARMQEQREKTEADILAVLTAEQKTKWTEMKGKEFKFPQPQGFGPGGRPGGPGGNAPGRRPESKKKDQ